jgi:hypothetical protein
MGSGVLPPVMLWDNPPGADDNGAIGADAGKAPALSLGFSRQLFFQGGMEAAIARAGARVTVQIARRAGWTGVPVINSLKTLIDEARRMPSYLLPGNPNRQSGARRSAVGSFRAFRRYPLPLCYRRRSPVVVVLATALRK